MSYEFTTITIVFVTIMVGWFIFLFRWLTKQDKIDKRERKLYAKKDS